MSTTPAAPLNPFQILMQGLGYNKPNTFDPAARKAAENADRALLSLPEPVRNKVYSLMTQTPAERRADTVADLDIKNQQQRTTNQIANENEAQRLGLTDRANSISNKAFGDRVGIKTDATRQIMGDYIGAQNRQSDYDQAYLMADLQQRGELQKELLALEKAKSNPFSVSNLTNLATNILGLGLAFS